MKVGKNNVIYSHIWIFVDKKKSLLKGVLNFVKVVHYIMEFEASHLLLNLLIVIKYA